MNNTTESITSLILTGSKTREEISEMYNSTEEEIENLERIIRNALEDTSMSEEDFYNLCGEIDSDYCISSNIAQ